MNVRLGVALVAASLSMGSANAATMVLLGTGTPGFTNFEITFNDTGNSLFDLAELTSFTGFNISGSGAIDGHWSTIVHVPNISGFAVASAGNPNPNTLWCFGGHPNFANCVQTGIARFTYSFKTDTNEPGPGGNEGGAGVVPEPSTWALMILAFAGLAWAMRRRAARA